MWTPEEKKDRFAWIEEYIERGGKQCGECPHLYVEHDVNFSLCMVLDKGEDPDDCPAIPEWNTHLVFREEYPNYEVPK